MERGELRQFIDDELAKCREAEAKSKGLRDKEMQALKELEDKKLKTMRYKH